MKTLKLIESQIVDILRKVELSRLFAMQGAHMRRAGLRAVALTLALTAPGAGADETGVREVAFSLYAPQAASVEIIGDFNQWQKGTTTLAGPDKEGRWWVRLTFPDPRNRIEYVYWVNDVYRQIDPTQPVVPDGFSGANNVLVLP